MEIVILLSVGFVAGTLGGLLGIGGSVIMIPATALLLGWPFHLAQAVAMTVNPAVAVSATYKHQKNNNVSWQTTKVVLPVALICICIAAWFSNQIPSHYLELLFGVFLIWVFIDQCKSVLGRTEPDVHPEGTPSLTRSSVTGGSTGTMAGLLGIGGGLIQVPLLNRVCGLPMKVAIGTSSSVMFITAIFGATVKDLSLPNCVDASGESLGLTALDALLKALWLIPGAIVGGFVGAWLTNLLPVKLIRIVFGLLVALASVKLISDAFNDLM